MTRILQHFSQILRLVWLLFPAILLIFLALIAFSGLSQGKDVLLMAAERRAAATLLVLSVTFFAFINWYTSRIIMYVYNETKLENNNPLSQFWMEAFPRILGYATFFCIQFSILKHPYFNIKNSTVWVLVLLGVQGLFYFIVYRYFRKHTDYKKFSIWLIVIVLVLVLFATFFFSGRGTIENNFFVQLICLWMVQTTFLVWVFIRAQKIKKNSFVLRWEHMTLFGLKIVRLPATEIPFFKGFNIALLFPLGLYMAAIFSIPTSRAIGSFNIVMLNFSILTGFLLAVTMVTLWQKINFHFLLFALAIIVGFFISPYKLRKTEVQEPVYNNRITLANYTQQWVETHKDAIMATDTFPMYFVLSDGGSSRSGYWVAGALGKLETETNHKFSNHLFCISGASGGSVGNAVYYSLLDESLQNKAVRNGNFSASARHYLSSDFLSTTLSHMLGPDYFRHIVPLNIASDRGGALEKSMEQPDNNDTIGRLFAQPYSEYLKHFSPKQLPIFFINTTRVADGSPGVISNIELERWFTPRIDVLNLLDTAGENNTPFGDINLSTAAVLSSRFPYLSPAANIDNTYFVDGGYFDNSGAGIVMETIAGIKTILADTNVFPKAITDKLQFKIIHLSNSEGSPLVPSRMHPMVNDLFTPLLTLAGSYGQQTNVNNDRLRLFIANYANTNCTDCWTRVNLYDLDTAIDKDYSAFSMNWVISDTTLRRMDARLEYNQNLNGLVKEISGYKE